MSNMRQTKRRSGGTNRDSQAPTPDAARQLELHAIEDRFLSDWHSGLRPQLAAYLWRYPDYSAELATFVANTFVPDSQSGALILIDNVPSYEHRGALSSGTWRALEAIFGADVGPAESSQSRVAERRSGYMNDVAPPSSAEDQSE